MKLYTRVVARVVTRHYIIVPRSIIVRYPENFRRKVGREATRRASIVKKNRSHAGNRTLATWVKARNPNH